MKRFPPILIFQVIALIMVCGISAFTALTLFGGMEGVMVASNPEASFKLVAPLACPNGTLEFESYHTTYNKPGENNFNVTCTAADGSQKDVSLQAIGYVTALSYLACFLPICVPLGLLVLVVPLFFRGKKSQAASTPPVSGPG